MSKETGGVVGGNASAAAECPVDHKSREAWLAHARAAQESQSQSTLSQSAPLQEQPHHSAWLPSLFSSSNATSNNKDGPRPTTPPSAEDKCPVDHHSREAWLKQARAAQEAQTQSQQSQQFPLPAKSITPTSTSNDSTKASGWRWPRVPFLSSAPSSTTTTESSATTPTTTTAQQLHPHPTKPHHGLHGLTTDREVSTIPRASAAGATALPIGPSNHETETGADPRTGNWVYPSEKMFFEAMKRKGHDTRVADMKTVVPIHNAVNERAWKEIREWEKPYEATTCPQGPMLYSFMGLSTNMSPRARLNTLLGYTAPFDRHDWIIDRCGKKVEYVIDFYAGKPGAAGGVPSFFLDVRPKLNSWEGVKMRALRGVGLA
ncbi:Cytochrome c1 heme lyase [Cytospora paraplurivora]